MMDGRMFVLWVIFELLSLSSGINESDKQVNGATSSIEATNDYHLISGLQELENVFDRQFLTINGKKLSLRQISGHIAEIPFNIKLGKKLVDSIHSGSEVIISEAPPDVGEICIGGQYIERKLHIWSTMVTHPDKSNLMALKLLGNPDTPTLIANKIASAATKETSLALMILGDVRVGKSVALAKVQYEMHKSMAPLWSIRVDLSNMYPTEESLPHITLGNIVRRYVAPGFLDFFYYILHINPTSIVILLDGVEHMTGHRTSKIISIIKTLKEKRAVVVLTGRLFTVELLRKHIPINICQIVDMSAYEMQEFFTHIWRKDVLEGLTTGTSVPNANYNAIMNRLKDYASVLTHTLFKTELPRQPVPLMILAEIFKRESSALFGLTGNTHPAGCLDYIKHPSALPPDLLVAMEYVQLNKNTLYEKFVAALTDNLEYLDWYYGVVAMAQLVQSHESPLEATKLLRPFIPVMESAEIMLKSNHELATFIEWPQGHKEIKFIHPEYQRFYAAKFVMTWIGTYDAPVNLLYTFLSDSYYSGMVEFLNFQIYKIGFISLPLSIVDNKNLLFDIMKNLITYGFDDMFYHTFNSILAVTENNVLQQYFVRNRIQMYLRPTHVLGMLRTTLPHSEPNLFETSALSIIVCSPLELLVENDMLRSCQLLESKGIWFINENNIYIEIYHNQLHRVVTKTVPNLQMLKFLMDHKVSDISTTELNNLLFRTIDTVGDGCQPIINYLVQLGAKPTEINIQGQTLLHAAVKWHSANLVRYVVEQLKIRVDTADDSGRTVFAAALDANPSPFYTFPGWYSMMLYVVQHVENLSLPTKDAITRQILRIPKEDIDSPWFKLMVFSMDNNYIQNIEYNFGQLVEINPIEWSHYSTTQFLALTRFIRHTSWPLTLDTLALRRNYWLQRIYATGESTISPLEILTHYRGVRSLPMIMHQQYQSTIGLLLFREKDILSVEVMDRILTALCNNIVDAQDFEHFKYLVNDEGLSLTSRPTARRLLINLLKDNLRFSLVMTINGPTSTNRKPLLLHERLQQSIIDYNPLDLDSAISQKMFTMLRRLKTYELLYQSYVTGAPLVQCLPHRTRRAVVFPAACHFSWEDVDHFNDAIDRRNVARIRVNSDNFLRSVAAEEHINRGKVQQLLSLVRELQNKPDVPTVITGKSQMLVRDLLRHGSLSGYRRSQRIEDIITNIWQSSSRTKLKRMSTLLPSETVALYAAASIPIIRGFHATIAVCLQQYNNTSNNDCLYSSSALALSVTLTAVGATSPKFVPWLIEGFSQTALDFLPSTAPRIMRENVKLMGHLGLKYGVKTVGFGLAIVGVGFDLYNIIEISKMINICSRQATGCTSRESIEYMISLSFSCVSIAVTGGLMVSGVGFVPGLLIGLGLLTVEAFAKGINDVIYYSNNYHTDFSENFRIFWHKVGFQPPPTDIKALAHRSEWVKNLQQRITELLDSSNENVVAYGVGLGMLTASGVSAGHGYVDMENANLENTKRLSRVIPTASENTTLLCLPQQDINEIYDKYPQNISDAEYKCQNTFVIAHKQRWKTRTSGRSYIIYDLQYIEEGDIIGSNTLNNLFLIYNSTTALNVIGGSGNIINTFMIGRDSFRGMIMLHTQPSTNVVDLSRIDSAILFFWWSPQYQMGLFQCGNNENNIFHLYVLGNKSSKLHIIGRVDKPDTFTCNYKKHEYLDYDQASITIAGGGGQSLSNMDYIIDCKISVVGPFTHIIGSDSTILTYTSYVWLEYGTTKSETTVYATIHPSSSKFIIIFINHPLFASSYSVKFTPSSRILRWTLLYKESSTMVLSIEPYRLPHSTLQQNSTVDESKIEGVNTIFIDSYFGSRVYPVINFPADENRTITIQHFNVFATVNSSRLEDVIVHYKNISCFNKEDLYVVTKLSYSTTGQSFIFGSSTNDRFYIDANTTFLFGGNGNDVYVLNSESSNCVWIENDADDELLDTLIISDATCDSIRAERSSLKFACCDSSPYDVTLFCSSNTITKSHYINIILRNYLFARRGRHLQIYWRDAIYVLLPYHWTHKDQEQPNANATKSIDLALFFSFGGEWQTTITLTSRDTYVIFNITGPMNPLVAYNSGFHDRDIVLARKYLTPDSSSFVVLQDFFSNDTNVTAVSTEWQKFKIFIIDNISDDAIIPMTLMADDVLNIFFDTLLNDTTRTQPGDDFIKEYFVNMTVPRKNSMIVIEHYNGSATQANNQLGVLTLTGVEPAEFHAYRDRRDNTSLSLCARQTCIIIKDWCQSIRHRLHRIEFLFTLDRQPIVIRNMNEINCPRQANNTTNDQVIELNEKFLVAQKQLLLTNATDENDEARLIRCIGSIFADSVARTPMYRVFGFASIIHQAKFMQDNCNALFTQDNLETLSFATMNKTFQNTLDIFQLGKPTPKREQSILLLRKSFKELNSQCWRDFKSSLINHKNKTEPNADSPSFIPILDHRERLLSKCVGRQRIGGKNHLY